jgi:dTDP-4-dehydrorhamnose reductase
MGSAFVALLALLVSCHSSAEPAAPGGTASLPAKPPAVAAAESAAGTPKTAAVEDVATVVDYLLQKIADSGLTFIRNGSEHTAAEAAAHIRDKYEHDQAEITTPEDFIAKAATSSVLTGQPYLVKTQDGQTRPAADWLRERLADYRAQRAQVGAAKG